MSSQQNCTEGLCQGSDLKRSTNRDNECGVFYRGLRSDIDSEMTKEE